MTQRELTEQVERMAREIADLRAALSALQARPFVVYQPTYRPTIYPYTVTCGTTSGTTSNLRLAT